MAAGSAAEQQPLAQDRWDNLVANEAFISDAENQLKSFIRILKNNQKSDKDEDFIKACILQAGIIQGIVSNRITRSSDRPSTSGEYNFAFNQSLLKLIEIILNNKDKLSDSMIIKDPLNGEKVITKQIIVDFLNKLGVIQKNDPKRTPLSISTLPKNTSLPLNYEATDGLPYHFFDNRILDKLSLLLQPQSSAPKPPAPTRAAPKRPTEPILQNQAPPVQTTSSQPSTAFHKAGQKDSGDESDDERILPPEPKSTAQPAKSSVVGSSSQKAEDLQPKEIVVPTIFTFNRQQYEVNKLFEPIFRNRIDIFKKGWKASASDSALYKIIGKENFELFDKCVGLKDSDGKPLQSLSESKVQKILESKEGLVVKLIITFKQQVLDWQNKHMKVTRGIKTSYNSFNQKLDSLLKNLLNSILIKHDQSQITLSADVDKINELIEQANGKIKQSVNDTKNPGWFDPFAEQIRETEGTKDKLIPDVLGEGLSRAEQERK